MRERDILYFAPDIRFGEVDLNGSGLPKQYHARIIGFYVAPAEGCAARGQAFASGVLLVNCIDALALVRYGGHSGTRFRRFAHEELGSFSPLLADRLYEDFRNGLVHEARVKNGGQFSLETGSTVEERAGLMLINPKQLAAEVRASVDAYRNLLNRDDDARRGLSRTLARDFAKEFAEAVTGGTAAGGMAGEPEAGTALHVADGHRGGEPEAAVESTAPRRPGVSVSAARCRGRAGRPGMEL